MVWGSGKRDVTRQLVNCTVKISPAINKKDTKVSFIPFINNTKFLAPFCGLSSLEGKTLQLGASSTDVTTVRCPNHLQSCVNSASPCRGFPEDPVDMQHQADPYAGPNPYGAFD